MEKFFKALTAIFIVCFCVLPALIGLTMIATGNGNNSGGSLKEKRIRYEKERAESIRKAQEQERMLKYQQIQNTNQSLIPVEPTYSTRRSAPTPDDAYDEGYNAGYEQGREDGSNGRSHGYGYDDSSSYYDYYETQYRNGYEVGYDDGYSAGESEYEEDEDE